MNGWRRLGFSLWYLLGKPPWDRGISPPELLDYISRHPAGRALDLGCGTGTNVITLARAGWRVTGVDFASPAIARARRKLRAAQVEADLHQSDVTGLEGIEGPFDLALDIGCFHGVEERGAYLETLNHLLRPGGTWLMYGFFKADPEDAGPGLTEEDLEQIRRYMNLIWRKDGTDRRERASAWFEFEKPQTAGLGKRS